MPEFSNLFINSSSVAGMKEKERQFIKGKNTDVGCYGAQQFIAHIGYYRLALTFGLPF